MNMDCNANSGCIIYVKKHLNANLRIERSGQKIKISKLLCQLVKIFVQLINIVMLLFLVIAVSLTFSICLAEAHGTIYIRSDGSVYPPTAPIQINGNVYVFISNIYESIIVERNNIVIDGKGYALEGNHNGSGILLKTVNNVTVRDIVINSFIYGVYLYNSSECNILETNITTSAKYGGYGIYLNESSNCNVYKNMITSTISGGYGIYIIYSKNNRISQNRLERNACGIRIQRASNNTFSYNSVAENNFGFYFCVYSKNNIVLGNNITKNNKFGAFLSFSSDNIIYHNRFIENGEQVYCERSINKWNYSYPSGGNYWSDYKGTDLRRGPYQNETGSDGIGDVPYVIDNSNIDYYPLLAPKPIDKSPPETSHDYDNKWHNVDFTINLTAKDDISGVAETYYKINDGSIKRVNVYGQPRITVESANNTLEYWSVDKAGNEETHHFIYGIKLDKTPPSGWIIINDNKTYANTSDVIIKFDYSDSLSGVSGIRFSNDDLWTNEPEKPPQLKMKNWTLTSGEGERTVYMQMIDKAGNIYTANDSIIVDSTPPRTTADYDKKWHNKDFYINLTSSDNFSTSPEIYYRIDNGPIKNVRADGQPYITNESTNNTLEYWSVDEAGNEETHHYLYGIKLDKTSPVADFDLPVKVEAGSQVKFDALKKSYDICSGISRCSWIFGDGTTSEEFIITHVYADTGKYNVTLTIIDMAGNIATCVKTVEVVPKPQLNFWLIIGLSGVITLAVISVVMAKNRSERKVKKEIRGKPPETYTSPAPPHEPVVTKEVKPVKVFKSREEELDDMVLDYIEAHGGTISLSRAAEDLGITYEELISSIDKLKNAGKLRQE